MDSGLVTIWKPGLYDAQFTIQVPADVEVDTTVALQHNSVSLPDMTVVVSHPAGASAVYSARAVLEVEAPSIFRLSSSNVIRYSGPGTLASWQFLFLG